MRNPGIVVVAPLPAKLPGLRGSQRGVTLAILLWFLVALSLLAATIMYQARVDIKLAQAHRDGAQAEALGDGAIQLALADLKQARMEQQYLGRGIFSSEYRLADTRVMVDLIPVSGLVSLNRASVDLLSETFIGGAGLNTGISEELAQNVLEWRSPGGATSFDQLGERVPQLEQPIRGRRFEAPEDLLQVPGINRDIFERVRPLIYVAQQEYEGIDWMSAPVEVLVAVAGLGREQANRLAEERLLSPPLDTTLPAELNQEDAQQTNTYYMRADARVDLAGGQYLRRRWVNTNRVSSTRLPWSFFRSEPVTAGGG